MIEHQTKSSHIRWYCIAVATILICAILPATADMYPRQPGIKILKYGFDVTLGDASDELVVNETVDVQFMADGVRAIDLDLCNVVSAAQAFDRLNPCLLQPEYSRAGTPPPPPSSVGKGMTVTAVSAGKQSLEFQHSNNRVHINFPAPSHSGEKFSFNLSYHGVPAIGLFIGKNKYGDRVFFTDNWPNRARNWLATIDHISVKTPKTISVTAPEHYQVLSNGLLTEQTDLPGDLRRTVWEESLPIASWQFSLAVAPMSVQYFGHHHEVQFSAWLFPQDRDSGRKAVDPLTQSVFEFYSDHIGPYSYEKLAQVDAAGGGGATEPATTIFYYGGDFRALSHEMAHQWFGNAVTESDWDDVWLSEGFATYFALLYTEHQDGHDPFLNGVRYTRDVAMKYALAHPADTVVHNNLANDSDVFFNAPQIYQGGAMVLHALRGVLGDTNFWAGIRLYSSRFRNASATTDDLRHAMEDACHAGGDCPAGDEDLSWFFHEWLNQGGIMQVKGGWHYDGAAKQLQVTVDQTQTQGLYRMPVQIGITLPPPPPSATPQSRSNRNRGPVVQTSMILVDKPHNLLTIPLDVEPTDVQLDPNTWVPLMQASFDKQ